MKVKMQQRDDEQKSKMKKHADCELKSRESSLKASDVLVRQPRRSKASSPFDPSPFKVVRRMGNTIIARRGNQEIARNISFFKKVNAKVAPHGEHSHDDFDNFDNVTDPEADYPDKNRRARPILRNPLQRSERCSRMLVRFQDFVVYLR